VLDGIAQVFYVLIHTNTCPAKSTFIGIRNHIQLSLGLDLGSEGLVLVLDKRSWSCLSNISKSWSWSCSFGLDLGLGLVIKVLLTSLIKIYKKRKGCKTNLEEAEAYNVEISNYQ